MQNATLNPLLSIPAQQGALSSDSLVHHTRDVPACPFLLHGTDTGSANRHDETGASYDKNNGWVLADLVTGHL